MLVKVNTECNIVSISPNDLLITPLEEIIQLLTKSPIQNWIDVAFTYFKLNKILEFTKVLTACAQKSKNVRVHNLLASYYMKEYLEERNLKRKEAMRTQVFIEINNANSCNRNIYTTIIKKGLVLLAEKDIDLARQYFDCGTELSNTRILSLYGKACIEYMQKEYNKALKNFQRIFLLQEHIDVRHNIALCFYKLGDINKAREGFIRCIKINNNNDKCLVYLAIIEMKKGKIQAAIKLLQEAYKLNQCNPLCLLYLAEHYFVINDLPKANKLALKALSLLECYNMFNTTTLALISNNEIDEMLVEVKFLLGKILFSRGILDQALKYFNEVNNNASIIYLAQVLCRLKKFNEAEIKLRGLLGKCNNPEYFKFLSICQFRVGKRKEAIENYNKVVNICSNDIASLLEFAQVLETEDSSKALMYYTQAITLIQHPHSKADPCKELLIERSLSKELPFNEQSSKELLSKKLPLEQLNDFKGEKEKVKEHVLKGKGFKESELKHKKSKEQSHKEKLPEQQLLEIQKLKEQEVKKHSKFDASVDKGLNNNNKDHKAYNTHNTKESKSVALNYMPARSLELNYTPWNFSLQQSK